MRAGWAHIVGEGWDEKGRRMRGGGELEETGCDLPFDRFMSAAWIVAISSPFGIALKLKL